MHKEIFGICRLWVGVVRQEGVDYAEFWDRDGWRVVRSEKEKEGGSEWCLMLWYCTVVTNYFTRYLVLRGWVLAFFGRNGVGSKLRRQAC